MRRYTLLIAGIATAAIVAAGAVLLSAPDEERRTGEGGVIGTTGEADIGGDFVLIDQDGNRRATADFRGRYMLLFFGYTHCPDFCPTTLQTVSHTLDRLGPLAERLQAVFISIDPARDSPQLLKDYGENFHPEIMYLTGNAEQVREAARAYRVYYSRQEVETGNDDAYLMNHSTFTYLMDPEGEFVTFFEYGLGAAELAERLRQHLQTETN